MNPTPGRPLLDPRDPASSPETVCQPRAHVGWVAEEQFIRPLPVQEYFDRSASRRAHHIPLSEHARAGERLLLMPQDIREAGEQLFGIREHGMIRGPGLVQHGANIRSLIVARVFVA